MAFVNWSGDLSVNVAEIDRQHKKLISLINELHDAMKAGKGRETLEKIINGLIVYAETHFSTEEIYFDRFEYPDQAAHRAEHASFIRKVLVFRDDLEKRKLTLSIDIIIFLRDWLQNHIERTDKKYSRLFNEKGLR